MPFGRADYRRAENAAKKVLEENSIFDAPVPVEEIASNYGLKLYRADFPDPSISGYIDLKSLDIVVNRADGSGRQAFTVAHELGHFVLHRTKLMENPDIGVVHRRPIGGEKDPIEQEANCFANNLLVPDFLLDKYYAYQPTPLVAKMFGVSEEVIRYRLKDTGRA